MTPVWEMYVHKKKFMHGWVFCRTYSLSMHEIYFKIWKINFTFLYLCFPKKWNNGSNKMFVTEAAMVNFFWITVFNFSTTYCLIPQGFSSWVYNPRGFGSKPHFFPFMTLPENGKLKSWLCLGICFLVSFHLLSDLPIFHSFSYTLHSLWYCTTFAVHHVCFCN